MLIALKSRPRARLSPCLALCLVWCVTCASPAAIWAACDPTPGLERFSGQGWGLDVENRRFQQASHIDRDNVAGLEVAWVFGLDGGLRPHSYPVVSEDTVFIGSEGGTLYALERASGCQRWALDVDYGVRSAVIHGRTDAGETRLFFGTQDGDVHAVDAKSGEHLWNRAIAEHAFAVPTGTPGFHGNTLYVPVSSFEVAMAMVPLYGCCTFRGALLALDAGSGELIWQRHMIESPPQVTGRRWMFIEQWGPSGAPVWSAPTLDVESGFVFVGTGENYSAPATDTSDAILAFDAATGERRWARQFTENDVYNMACSVSPEHPNCPEANGPDLDFGAPPMLARLGESAEHSKLLIAGQKSGHVYAMEPATGKLIWQQRLGRGGYLGGVHWGLAVNEALGMVYVPISDHNSGQVEGESAAGLHALDLDTGEILWSYPSVGDCEGKMLCWSGFSAAILATPELVFAGSLDGMLRAFDAKTGAVLWSFQTWDDYESVNGLPTFGGAIDVHGPMLFEDTLLVQSGYSTFAQAGGNALIAFSVPRP